MPLITRVTDLSLSAKVKEGVAPPSFYWSFPFLAFLVAALVYLPGLPGGFEFDDGINIVQNPHIHIKSLDLDSLSNAALSTTSGPLRRPVAMLTLAVNYYFSQDSVVGYKVVNIAIHALNAVLVYFLSLKLLTRLPDYRENRFWLALAISMLWSCLPINLTSVLYVIQRMVSLGASFALLAIIAWFHARLSIERNERIPWLWGAVFLICLSLAVLCKETYVLTCGAVLLLDWLLFARARRLERVIMAIQVSGVVLAAALAILVLLLKPEMLVGDFSQRPFDMTERLLTQGRALLFYVGLMAFPSNLRLGLYHDYFEVSRGLFEPVTTLLSFLVIFLVLFMTFRRRKRNQLLFLGVSWFLCWHLIESTIVSLELVHEHRNYLASLGIVWVGLCFYSALKALFESKIALSFVVALLVGWNVVVTVVRANEWSNLVDHALAEVNHHPDSVRAKYQLGRIYLMLYYQNRDKTTLRHAYQAFGDAALVSDYDLLPLFGMIRVKLIMQESIEEEVKDLSGRLRKDKIPAATVAALSGLQECIKAAQCDGLQPYFTGLIDSLLSNATLDERSLSQLYTLKAAYYSEVENNYDQSSVALKQGLQILPMDYHLRKSLLYYYVITVKLDQAALALEAFNADFGGRRDADRVVREVCDIFLERDFSAGCDFMTNK